MAKIAIYGAGSTGCFLGALLALNEHDVTLICRERIKRAIIEAGGIRVTDYEGLKEKIMPSHLLTNLSGNEKFDVVFVTLKCHQIESSKEDLCSLANNGSKLYFMQNGLDSLQVIQNCLPSDSFFFGIIPFNVLSGEQASFFRATDGTFILQETKIARSLLPGLQQFHFDVECQQDMKSVSYGKLLLNINNALNAISDIPIKAELENPIYRRVLSAAMEEWLLICRRENVKLYQYTSVKPKYIPKILKLPNWLFTRIAKAMLDIDPQARSSMWEDIQAGRKTEIAFLNGAIIKRGKALGINTPVNQAIVDAIKLLECGDKPASAAKLNQIAEAL